MRKSITKKIEDLLAAMINGNSGTRKNPDKTESEKISVKNLEALKKLPFTIIKIKH